MILTGLVFNYHWDFLTEFPWDFGMRYSLYPEISSPNLLSFILRDIHSMPCIALAGCEKTCQEQSWACFELISVLPHSGLCVAYLLAFRGKYTKAEKLNIGLRCWSLSSANQWKIFLIGIYEWWFDIGAGRLVEEVYCKYHVIAIEGDGMAHFLTPASLSRQISPWKTRRMPPGQMNTAEFSWTDIKPMISSPQEYRNAVRVVNSQFRWKHELQYCTYLAIAQLQELIYP